MSLLDRENFIFGIAYKGADGTLGATLKRHSLDEAIYDRKLYSDPGLTGHWVIMMAPKQRWFEYSGEFNDQ